MKRFILWSLLALSSLSVSAQTGKSETEAIKKVVNQLFDGMRKGDSSLVSATFSNDMILQTISSRTGSTTVRTEKPEEFLRAVGTPHTEIWDERITFDQVLVDGALASVWTSYKFYINDKFSHCGVNSFQLVKGNEGWKIVYLIDTRRKDNCN